MCQAKVWQMNPPVFDNRPLVVMCCGDNDEAKQQIAVLIEDVGCKAKDMGNLKYARMLETAAAVVIKMLFVRTRYPYSFDFNTPKSKGDLNKNQHTIYAVFIHS
jgi:hypothetical protein